MVSARKYTASGQYLSGVELEEGKVYPVTIDRCEEEYVENPKTGQRDRKLVVYFKNKQKGLILNVTNIDRLAHNVGSDETDDWIGRKIALRLEPSGFMRNGQMLPGIRIVPKEDMGKVKADPEPEPAPVSDIDPDAFNDDSIPF